MAPTMPRSRAPCCFTPVSGPAIAATIPRSLGLTKGMTHPFSAVAARPCGARQASDDGSEGMVGETHAAGMTANWSKIEFHGAALGFTEIPAIARDTSFRKKIETEKMGCRNPWQRVPICCYPVCIPISILPIINKTKSRRGGN